MFIFCLFAVAFVEACGLEQEKISNQLILGSWKVVAYEEVRESNLKTRINIEVPGVPVRKDSSSDTVEESEHKPNEVYHFMDDRQLNLYRNDLNSKEKYNYRIVDKHLLLSSPLQGTVKYTIEKINSDTLELLEPYDKFSDQYKIICVKIPNIFIAKKINEDSKKLSIDEISDLIFKAMRDRNFQLIDRINVNDNEQFKEQFEKSFWQVIEKGIDYGIRWKEIELEKLRLDNGIILSDSSSQLDKLLASTMEPEGYFVEIVISQNDKRFSIDCGYLNITDWGWSFNREFKIDKVP